MKIGYICDNCEYVHENKTWIFNCVDCGKEICDMCMYGWATCKECAPKHTNAELRKRFEEENEIVAP